MSAIVNKAIVAGPVMALVLALAATPVCGQDKGGSEPPLPASPLIGKLDACTSIADNTERLACFDREVSALVGASSEGAVRVVEQKDITQARKKLFGYSVPDAGIFAARTDEEREDAKTLVSTITRVRKINSREYQFWIEEGDAMWRMKGTTMRFRAPKVGDEVEFAPASMGTYWIRVNGRKGVRGNRIG